VGLDRAREGPEPTRFRPIPAVEAATARAGQPDFGELGGDGPVTFTAVNTKLSREAYDRLKAEFDDLSTRGKVEIARKIEAARELGDLSENGDYHAAKEEQGRMDGRMKQILAIIESVEIVETVDTRAVSAGTVVEVRYEGDNWTERYLVGSIEERREGIDVASPSSPLGAALIGRAAGETVEYRAPGGMLRVEIVSISA
jgi:transcription elongation factor GreA